MTRPTAATKHRVPSQVKCTVTVIQLESRFREECEIAVARSGDNENQSIYYVDYIAQILGAISALGLESAFMSDVPRIENVEYNTYLNFSKDVKHYTTQLRIRHARRAQGFSARFDGTARTKIHHFIAQIREFLQRLELDVDRKESLLDKLNIFSKEVDRDRTRLEAWGNLTIAIAGVVGEATEKLLPLRNLIDSIARVIWGTQSDSKPMLPAPSAQKRIEPPNVISPKDADDEIPF